VLVGVCVYIYVNKCVCVYVCAVKNLKSTCWTRKQKVYVCVCVRVGERECVCMCMRVSAWCRNATHGGDQTSNIEISRLNCFYGFFLSDRDFRLLQ